MVDMSSWTPVGEKPEDEVLHEKAADKAKREHEARLKKEQEQEETPEEHQNVSKKTGMAKTDPPPGAAIGTHNFNAGGLQTPHKLK